MPGEPGPGDWQPTLAQTQADRHQAWKACTTVILGEAWASPVICPLQSYQLQSANTPWRLF